MEKRIQGAGRTKKFNQKVTSSFQKEVLLLLVSTGLNRIKEYSVDGYTVDAVCILKSMGQLSSQGILECRWGILCSNIVTSLQPGGRSFLRLIKIGKNSKVNPSS